VASLPEVMPRFDSKIVSSGAAPPVAGYFALAAIPARYALERQEWKAAAQLEVRETPFPYTEAMTYFARGLASAHLGDIASARVSGEALTKIHDRLAKSNEGYWAEQVEIQRRGVSAWTALAEMLLQMNRPGEALEEFEATLKREPNRFRALYGEARRRATRGRSRGEAKVLP
jgi:tetratricopeptide (TPR) repeat protein